MDGMIAILWDIFCHSVKNSNHNSLHQLVTSGTPPPHDCYQLGHLASCPGILEPQPLGLEGATCPAPPFVAKTLSRENTKIYESSLYISGWWFGTCFIGNNHPN